MNCGVRVNSPLLRPGFCTGIDAPLLRPGFCIVVLFIVLIPLYYPINVRASTD